MSVIQHHNSHTAVVELHIYSITVFICLQLRSLQLYLVMCTCTLLTIDQEYNN